MDADRFDTVARSLTTARSRRCALSGLLLGTLGLLGWSGAQDASAKNCKKIKNKKKRKKCQKKANETNPGTSPPPTPLTCAQTCNGCCDSGGVCHAGTTTATCGTGGEVCATCTGDEVCTGGDCVVPACGAGGPCRVFVTSTAHKGNLQGTSASGLEGADEICQQRAREARLPGTYTAWLSDKNGSPATRFVQSTGPYRRLDGVTVADNYTDLTTCDSSDPFACLDNAIDLMEDGVTRTNNAIVWTNTLASGAEESPTRSCENWTKAERGPDSLTANVAMSDPIVTNRSWTDLDSVQFCDVPCRLYCFQQT